MAADNNEKVEVDVKASPLAGLKAQAVFVVSPGKKIPASPSHGDSTLKGGRLVQFRSGAIGHFEVLHKNMGYQAASTTIVEKLLSMSASSGTGFKNTINTAAEYDAAIARANEDMLVIIAVWSEANPICDATEPKIQKMAAEYRDAEFYKMHLNGETQPMIKFGIQNTPIFICSQGEWATTILGANMKMLEDALRSRTS